MVADMKGGKNKKGMVAEIAARQLGGLCRVGARE
jgi:hypothetical protein